MLRPSSYWPPSTSTSTSSSSSPSRPAIFNRGIPLEKTGVFHLVCRVL
jgi:hypothetical protein